MLLMMLVRALVCVGSWTVAVSVSLCRGTRVCVPGAPVRLLGPGVGMLLMVLVRALVCVGSWTVAVSVSLCGGTRVYAAGAPVRLLEPSVESC